MLQGIFDLCVAILAWLAQLLGMTYVAINVWIFCVIWPAITLGLLIAWLCARRPRVPFTTLAGDGPEFLLRCSWCGTTFEVDAVYEENLWFDGTQLLEVCPNCHARAGSPQKRI